MVSLQDWGPLRQKFNFERSSESKKLFQRYFLQMLLMDSCVQWENTAISMVLRYTFAQGYRTHRGAAQPAVQLRGQRLVHGCVAFPGTCAQSQHASGQRCGVSRGRAKHSPGPLLMQRWWALCPWAFASLVKTVCGQQATGGHGVCGGDLLFM